MFENLNKKMRKTVTRLEQCKSCDRLEKRGDNLYMEWCPEAKCFVHILTRIDTKKCPLGKW